VSEPGEVVVERRVPLPLKVVWFAGFALGPVGSQFLSKLVVDYAPWLPHYPPWWGPHPGVSVADYAWLAHVQLEIQIGLVVLWLVALFFVAGRFGARYGHVGLRPEGIVFKSVFFRAVSEGRLVPWSELGAYRDDSIDYVELVMRNGATRTPRWIGKLITIPTPTETDRAAVLAELDRRGLVRLDPELSPPRSGGGEGWGSRPTDGPT
jgi:hypothetical protein